ncbi:MAG: hypothetical protein ONB24_09330 [candidate division KSB1 bacterium]|nr:hypothetical protein [candidate division KSB1 bacterium]
MKKALVFLLLAAAWATADVKKASVTTMEFGGTFGKMVKFFGGGKPTTNVDYYTQAQHRNDSFRDGKLATTQIIDLDRELFITIDHKNKTFTQMTFDEWRRMMRETMENLQESKEEEKEKVEWKISVDVKETGEKETIAGLAAEKVILSLKMESEVTEQKEGKAPETSRATLYAVSDEWLHRGQQKAAEEMQAFQLALAKKLGLLPDQASMQSMIKQVFASYPQLAEAMERLQKEGKKLEGFPLRLKTVYESEGDHPQSAKEEKSESPQIPTSVGGLAGAIGKKMLEKQAEKKASDRVKLLTITEEVTELSRGDLSADLFMVPAGYKESKPEK